MIICWVKYQSRKLGKVKKMIANVKFDDTKILINRYDKLPD